MVPPRIEPKTPSLGRSCLRFFKWFLFWAVVLFAVCTLSGRDTPHTVPDTPSYTDYVFSPADRMAREIRTPAYPMVLAIVSGLVTDTAAALQIVVWLQILLHAAAVTILMGELRAWRLSVATSFVAAAAVAIGCTFWDNVSTIATDCPAMSVGVMTATLILRGWRTGFPYRLSLAVGGSVLMAIALRPACLFLLPWALLLTLIRCRDGLSVSLLRRTRDTIWVASVPFVGLFGWCLFRYQSVGDFSLLPFGHQNMAAVTTQLLDNDELRALPQPSGKLGSLIGKMRIAVSQGTRAAENLRWSADGLDLRTASDPAQRADSYMTLENRWDAMTYRVVIPAAREIAGEDIIGQHRLLARLDRQIVRSYPLRYARWWMLAVRRGLWGSIANLVMHPVFFIIILLLCLLAVSRCVVPISGHMLPSFLTQFAPFLSDVRTPESTHFQAAFAAFTLITMTYAAANLGFIALTSPTIGRFCDPGFVFVPALVLAGVIHSIRPLR